MDPIELELEPTPFRAIGFAFAEVMICVPLDVTHLFYQISHADCELIMAMELRLLRQWDQALITLL